MTIFNANINITFDDLMNEVTRRKEDFIASRSEIKVFPNNEIDGYAIGMQEGGIGEMIGAPATNFAMQQLATRTAPGLKALYDHTKATFPQNTRMQNVFSATMNEYLSSVPNRFVVRTQDLGYENTPMVARGVVGQSYKCLDTDMMLESIAPAVCNSNFGWDCIGGNRTQSRDHMRYVSTDPVFTMTDPQGRLRKFHSGFMASNSEVGHGKLAFSVFFTDAFCTNGMIFSKMTIAGVNYMHKGARIETDFGTIIGSSARQAEQDSMRVLLAEAAEIATSNQAFPEIEANLRRSMEEQIPTDVNPADAVVPFIRLAGLNKRDNDSIAQEFCRSGDFSRFGLASAITAVAQHQNTFDNRIAMETAGGDILTMSASSWDATCSKIKAVA